MKRILLFCAMFALLTVGGALLRWTVFLDVERFRDDIGAKAATVGSAEFYREMPRRFHRGDGPCLRYIDQSAISDEELDKTVSEADTLGVTSQLKPLFPLFLRWSQETDAPHHATDQAEELLLVTREHLGGLDRFVLALNYQKVLRAARMREAGAMSRLIGEAERNAEPATRGKLHLLWEHHPLALSVAGVFRLGPRLRTELR
jgi:hypothetical protein